MKIIERTYITLVPGKMGEMQSLIDRFNTVCKGFGQPETFRAYRALSSVDSLNTVVMEFDWDNFSTLEVFLEKQRNSKEYQELFKEMITLCDTSIHEFYTPESWGIS
jgi:hypothetical protein